MGAPSRGIARFAVGMGERNRPARRFGGPGKRSKAVIERSSGRGVRPFSDVAEALGQFSPAPDGPGQFSPVADALGISIPVTDTFNSIQSASHAKNGHPGRPAHRAGAAASHLGVVSPRPRRRIEIRRT